MSLLNKHKRYKILNFENSYCLVQEMTTNEFHKCFSLDNHKVGDVVYLFNAGKNKIIEILENQERNNRVANKLINY